MWLVSVVAGSGRNPRSADERAADQAALARVITGDHAGLAELYDRHAGAVLSLALRVLRDPVAAEDTVQEVFTQAWRKATAYDAARGTVGAWLTTMTRSRAIDALRARRARPDGTADDRVTLTLVDRGPEPDQQAVDTQQGVKIREALTALPDLQRQAIELAYYEGLTHAEVAARLAEPLGTVKTRIRTGLLKLREQLADLI